MYSTREIYVKNTLENILRIESRTYVGDYNAVVELMDLANAIASADLTDRQKEALELYYIQGYKQPEVGLIKQESQQTVSYLLSTSIKKIAHAYEKGRRETA